MKQEKRMGAIFLFLGWCIHLSLVEGKTPRFRGDAESFMDAGFRTLRRRGGVQKDFTKIEVTASLVLQPTCYWKSFKSQMGILSR